MCHIKNIYRTEFNTLLASIALVRIDIHKIDFKGLVSFAHNLYLLLELFPLIINQLGKDAVQLLGMYKGKFAITKRPCNLAF